MVMEGSPEMAKAGVVKRILARLVDGLEARKSLELINAIYESVETGREVFLRFLPRKCPLGRPVA